MIEGMYESAKQTIETQVMNNDFFAGGFLLGLLTTVAMFLRGIPAKVRVLFVNRFTTRVYVDSTQDTFGWIHIWMSHQDFGQRARRISIRVKNYVEDEDAVGRPRFFSSKNTYRTKKAQKTRSRIAFSLGEGKHYVKYAGKWLRLELSREKPQGNNSGSSTSVYESITIRYLGTKRNILEEIVDESIRLATPDKGDYVDLYMFSGYSEWVRMKRKSGRSPASLAYKPGLFKSVVKDIIDFRESFQRYQDLGIPYKKTYLFHGPPGSGKTSMAIALATELHSAIYYIDLSAGSGAVKNLLEGMHDIQDNSLVLIEDIHTVGAKPGKKENGDEYYHLSVEGLTNIIDGVLSAEGIVLLMTTNYPELLDERLVRPGRIDRKIYLGNACQEQAAVLAHKFYPDANGEIKEFVNSVEDDKYSMAQLQEYFLRTPLESLLSNRAELDSIVQECAVSTEPEHSSLDKGN